MLRRQGAGDCIVECGGLGQQLVDHFFWNTGDFLRFIIITDHARAGVAHRHPFFTSEFFQFIIKIEADAGKFRRGDGGAEGVAIEEFASELDGDVGHDEAYARQIQFLVAMVAEELDPYLMDEGKDGVVADMTAVIEIGDAHRKVGGEREVFGEGKFGSWHMQSYLGL